MSAAIPELTVEHLPWVVEPDPVHGASIRDAKGNQIVAHIYDEEKAGIIVAAVNGYWGLIRGALAGQEWAATKLTTGVAGDFQAS